MRTPRSVALAVLAVLAMTACGARLPASERQTAANADLGAGSSVNSGPAPVTTGAAAPTASTATQSSNHVLANSTCPTGGTDVGETATTLNLGSIADVTGPVPGLFDGAEQGINAWAAYINATGGLCGHQVKIDFQDGATSCSTNETDTENLVKKDFAEVGTFSLYDGCGATVLQKNPTIPDVHDSLDATAEALPNHFDLEPGQAGYATGMWKYYAQKLGSKVQDVGTIVPAVPSAEAKQKDEVKAAESQGWKFTYTDTVPSTDGDFTSDFNKMCAQKHVKVFFEVSTNAQNAATMIHDENQVSACKGLVNIIPIAYDQSFLTFCKQLNCGATANTVQGWNEYSLFFNAGEAANIPELKLFQSWFQKTNPGKPLNLYALFAWASGRMFQQAYESAGTTATRQTVLASLNKIKKFSDNGVVSPTDPSSKTDGNTCYIAWKLNNGVYSRQGDPKAGFRCDGTYLKY